MLCLSADKLTAMNAYVSLWAAKKTHRTCLELDGKTGFRVQTAWEADPQACFLSSLGPPTLCSQGQGALRR